MIIELVKSNKIQIDTLKTLPKNLLKIILNIFSKRGLLTDTNIYVFLNEQTKLLELSECDKITDLALGQMSACKNLSKIDINSNSSNRELVTSEGVVNLAKSCPHLRTVLLRRCVKVDDRAVESIVSNCPRLANLNLGNCPLITDKSLVSLGKKCKFLKSVNLTATQVFIFLIKSNQKYIIDTKSYCEITLAESSHTKLDKFFL